MIAESKTAEADISFTFFMVRLNSGQTKSQSFSMAELIISKLNTIAKQIKMINHSVSLNEKNNPAIITINAITYCILKFFSCNRQSFKPANAQANDLITLMVFFRKIRKYLQI